MSWLCLWLVFTAALLWPLLTKPRDSLSGLIPPGPGGINYLIIASEGLEDAARAWQGYRQAGGSATQLLIYPRDATGIDAIRAAIIKSYQRSGSPNPFYVLLLGHAHPASSYREAYLPTVGIPPGSGALSGYGVEPIASDDGYRLDARTGAILPILIGRIPARTDQEAREILGRIRSYEEQPPTGLNRTQVELIASDPGFNEKFDGLIEALFQWLIEKHLPPGYSWHMLYGNPSSAYHYPVQGFPKEAAERFNQSALLTLYIGHGQPEMLAWVVEPDGYRGRVLGQEDATLIHSAASTLAVFTACSAGRFDLPGDTYSVVEALFLQPGGPVITYSSSAWINAVANLQLAQSVLQGLLADRPMTIGEWMRRTEAESRPSSDGSLSLWIMNRLLPSFSAISDGKLLISKIEVDKLFRWQHLSYNLFGDPAMRLALPQRDIQVHPTRVWFPFTSSLDFEGKSPLSPGQVITVTLEIHPSGTVKAKAPAGNEIERYRQANKKTVSTTIVKADDTGRFSGKILLPRGLPGGEYRLRAVSIKENATYVGTSQVYLGWSSVLAALNSIQLWWAGLSLGGLVLVAYAARHK